MNLKSFNFLLLAKQLLNHLKLGNKIKAVMARGIVSLCTGHKCLPNQLWSGTLWHENPGKMASMEEKPGMQEINLMSLAIPQLNQLKNQLDQELGVFQESLETLKIAQNKLVESKESLKKITKDSLGAEILVPLSASMYVPGKIADAEHAIIDIGTGYYVQKDIEGGIDYFKRKVDFVTEQMEKIQMMGMEKSKVRDAIVEVMEIKLQAHLQSSKPATET